jgi:nucleoside 2-deoxyribosyltransferase
MAPLKRVYLAGPFFNEKQIELIEKVETLLHAWNIQHFSPRKMTLNGNPTTSKPTPESAKQIFKNDYHEICNSTHVIAVIDWALMPSTSLRIIKDSSMVTDEHVHGESRATILSGPIQIPDSGTVWEMGCAYALRVPVYLFTANPTSRLNLMLSQSARGVIYGFSHLENFLMNDMNEVLLEQWKGEHR